MTTLTVADGDGVLVMRADGTMDLVLPSEGKFTNAQCALVGAAMMLEDKAFVAKLVARVQAKAKEAGEESEGGP